MGYLDKPKLYVTPTTDGVYAVRRAGSMRASAVCLTEEEAICRARSLEPDAIIYKQIEVKPGNNKWVKC